MDFFKSVFTDEPDPSDLSDNDNETNDNHTSLLQSPPDQPHESPPTPKSPSSSPSWSFGGLIKTFTSKSETVLQTYRRDLEEFGAGLKNETAAIREAATRAVKDLPASIDLAQGSIESVLRGTAEIIAQSKDTLLSDLETESSQTRNSKPYSRFETQVTAIQTDVNTYVEQVEDLEDFDRWKKSGFLLEDKGEEIMDLLGENGVMEGIYTKIVPGVIDHDTFWGRYFYKLYKLKQVEDARANLVKRAISGEDEDLSWEVDDDDGDNNVDRAGGKDESTEFVAEKHIEEEANNVVVEGESVVEKHMEEQPEVAAIYENKSAVTESSSDDKKVALEEKVDLSALNIEEAGGKSDEKVMEAEKGDPGMKSKESEVSVVSNKPSMPEEEDLGWDEIEDIGSGDEKKVTTGVSPNISDVRKRLSATEEDEDLNWDIEDDDEPVKH